MKTTSLSKITLLLLFCFLSSYASVFSQNQDSLRPIYTGTEYIIPTEVTQFDEAISHYKSNGDLAKLALVYEEKGDLLLEHSIYASAVYYENALKIYQTLSDQEATTRLTKLIANAYYDISDYNNSLVHFYSLLDIYQEENDTLKIAQTHSTIGSLYDDLGNSKLSFKHQNLALELSFQLNNKRGIAAISNNIAGLYRDLDCLDIAFAHVRRAEEINLEMDNQYWLSINYSLYSDFYRSMGIYDSARYYLLKSNAYTNVSGTMADSIDMFRKTGVYYYYVDSVPKALNEFNKGILLSRRMGSLKSEANFTHWISEVYENNSNMEMAISFLQSHYDLLDSLKERQSEKKTEELQVLYNVKELEQTLSLSISEQKVAEQKIEKTQNRLITFLIVSVLLLVFSLVFFIQYRKQLKSNKHLLKLNLETLPTDTSPKSKYAQSTLSDEKKQRILQEFTSAMVDEELFKNQDLKLETVANQLGVGRTYLSQVINETYSQSFNAYVNYCRISLSKKYLLSSTYEAYSIKGVAETVGFKSLSAFNASFKKVTGLTPSYYRKNGGKTKT